MRHDLNKGDEVKGIFVEDGILDAQYLARILSILQLEGRVMVTGVKKIDLPRQFLEVCATCLEMN